MVLGGAGLFAAFPLVYSTVLSALYLPIILMVVALIIRGVVFEFRFKAHRTKYLWDLAFSGGFLFSSFFQGVILRAYIQGIETQNGIYSYNAESFLFQSSPCFCFDFIGIDF